MNKIGFIGAGNMATALIKGLYSSNDQWDIYAYDKYEEKVSELSIEYDVTKSSFIEIATNCNIIILAVKPNIYPAIINNLNNHIQTDVIIVSITPSFSLDELTSLFTENTKIVRAMPNTPALVREGITGISFNDVIDTEEKDMVKKLFTTIGKVHIVEEKLMNAIVGVSGSSPAYAYIFIEALADAGVKHGIPRDLAYEFAAQSLLGSSKMVLETKEHPAKLKDNVSSPGGTTIEAIAALEENGFRNSIIKAVDAAVLKCTNM